MCVRGGREREELFYLIWQEILLDNLWISVKSHFFKILALRGDNCTFKGPDDLKEKNGEEHRYTPRISVKGNQRSGEPESGAAPV